MNNKFFKALCAALGLSFLFTFGACASEQNGADAPLPDSSEEQTSPDNSSNNVPETPEISTGSGNVEEPVPPTETEEPEEETPAVKTAQYIYVKTDNLTVRAKASAASSSYGQLDEGVSLLYLGKENGFYKTYYKNTVAYISANENYTKIYTMSVNDEKIERVITEGCKLIGTKYVYGAVRYHDGYGNKYSGFTVTKFDCSSLTQYVFYRGCGALLQVNTRTQIYQGRHVDKSDLARGDLIFFTNDSRYYNTGIERVGHVAIYLGDNKILHTASDYCKIEEMTTKRWNYYIEARRIS